MLAGVEEAGRGPVIGPLVTCIVMIDPKQEFVLKQIGVKDSKLLSPLQRERLAEKIRQVAKVELVILPPKVVDEAVNSDTTNLNWLEADAFASLITKLKPTKAIIDCPSQNIPAFTAYMQDRVPEGTELLAEHKADVNHPVVSAASIIAKVTRDAEVEKLKAKVGVNFGSGYPSDPLTVAFLEANWEKHPELFRHSWASYKRLVVKKEQKSLGEY